MQFEDRAPDTAKGWRLAHSVKTADSRLPKGLTLEDQHIASLVAAQVSVVHVFRFEASDVEEDMAAAAVAGHVAGAGLTLGHATHGRCNLHADAAGLLLVDEAVNRLNAADEAITIATLPHLAPVRTGQLVATAKIIPYGVAADALDAALQAPEALSVVPFKPFRASLIATGQDLPAKARALTETRLERLMGRIDHYESCDHGVMALAKALTAQARTGHDLIMILGLSAISDRRDVVPAALEAAGGEIVSLGMPVDPGNLLMLGRLGEKTVLGLPGCARSPALNGLDWVLERFAARLPLDRHAIAAMGIGGLLKETLSRPEPRAPLHLNVEPAAQALVLAAGRSSRAGSANKLLAPLNGKTVIRQTVATLAQATESAPVVVTGHEGEAVAEALSGLDVTIAHNMAYADGMASSLKCGIKALQASAEFVCIALGDMPFVKAETVCALAATANRLSEAKIFIPTFNGKRGHPVLWHRDALALLESVTGDMGGRAIVAANAGLVCEVPVDDPGILIDLDTPEALRQFGLDIS